MKKYYLPTIFALLYSLLVISPVFAQDHADIAQAAFDASALPAPPRSVESALPYITRLLSMLPAGEKAGYVKGPAGGDNVAALSDGTLVRVSRVIYPNGQIFKVMSDAPNGNPQWVAGDVLPDLYVPFGGSSSTPPVVVTPPVVTPPAGLDTEALQRLRTIEAVVADIRQQNLLHETAEAQERAEAKQFRSDVADKWKNFGLFTAKYIAPIVGGLLGGKALAN